MAPGSPADRPIAAGPPGSSPDRHGRCTAVRVGRGGRGLGVAGGHRRPDRARVRGRHRRRWRRLAGGRGPRRRVDRAGDQCRDPAPVPVDGRVPHPAGLAAGPAVALPRRAAALPPVEADRRAPGPRRHRSRAGHDGAEATRLLDQRGAARDGRDRQHPVDPRAARPHRPGALPRPGADQPGLHLEGRGAGRTGPAAGGRGVDRRPRELRRRAGGEDPRPPGRGGPTDAGGIGSPPSGPHSGGPAPGRVRARHRRVAERRDRGVDPRRQLARVPGGGHRR